ncbi:hypothetical protein D8B46_01850 [Candidatus Gracilibacteria bacterium]|nr:MAG: hypothetical protein D8B46_01850 [Candidatus Gracilibacteria bacterium]
MSIKELDMPDPEVPVEAIPPAQPITGEAKKEYEESIKSTGTGVDDRNGKIINRENYKIGNLNFLDGKLSKKEIQFLERLIKGKRKEIIDFSVKQLEQLKLDVEVELNQRQDRARKSGQENKYIKDLKNKVIEKLNSEIDRKKTKGIYKSDNLKFKFDGNNQQDINEGSNAKPKNKGSNQETETVETDAPAAGTDTKTTEAADNKESIDGDNGSNQETEAVETDAPAAGADTKTTEAADNKESIDGDNGSNQETENDGGKENKTETKENLEQKYNELTEKFGLEFKKDKIISFDKKLEEKGRKRFFKNILVDFSKMVTDKVITFEAVKTVIAKKIEYTIDKVRNIDNASEDEIINTINGADFKYIENNVLPMQIAYSKIEEALKSPTDIKTEYKNIFGTKKFIAAKNYYNNTINNSSHHPYSINYNSINNSTNYTSLEEYLKSDLIHKKEEIESFFNNEITDDGEIDKHWLNSSTLFDSNSFVYKNARNNIKIPVLEL